MGWSSYSAFASAQSNILSKNTIKKENYIADAAPMTMDQDDMKNDDIADAAPSNGAMPPPNNYSDENIVNNYDNGNDAVPMDNQYVEDQYVEENDNGPTDDYNPFGE